MKDGRFENQAEIYQALLSGKKIATAALPTTYFHLEGNFFKNEQGTRCSISFKDPEDWILFAVSRTCQAFISKHGEMKYALEGSIDAGLYTQSNDYERAPGFDKKEEV